MDKKMKRKLLLELDWLVRNKGDKNKIHELKVKLGIVEDGNKVSEKKEKTFDTMPFKLQMTVDEYIKMRSLNLSLREIAFIKDVAYNTIYNFRDKHFGGLEGEKEKLYELRQVSVVAEAAYKRPSRMNKANNKLITLKDVVDYIDSNNSVIHVKPGAEELDTSPYRFKQHIDYLLDKGYIKIDSTHIRGMDVKGYSKTNKFEELKGRGK